MGVDVGLVLVLGVVVVVVVVAVERNMMVHRSSQALAQEPVRVEGQGWV